MQNRDIGWVIGVVVIIVVLFGFLGGGVTGWGGMWPGMMGGFYGSGHGSWGGGLMMLFWPLVIGGIVLLGIWLLREAGSARPTSSSSRGETALDILKQRYASGEITREQFEQMRREVG